MNSYPIVLAHGIARFDIVRQMILDDIRSIVPFFNFPTDELHYFRKIGSHLTQRGFVVAQPNVNFAGDVKQRARDLGSALDDFLSGTPHEKVHIIAHSMGGLDARHMLFHNHHGMRHRVASLTTIGTPHLGTSVADVGMAIVGDQRLDLLKLLLGLDITGFRDLSTQACKEVNEEMEDFEAKNDVFYQTYAASQDVARTFSLIKFSWRIIQENERNDGHGGANDGLVSRKSQWWTAELRGQDGTVKRVPQHLFSVPADHLNEIGWWDLDELNLAQFAHHWDWWSPREFETAVKQQYLDIARRLHQL